MRAKYYGPLRNIVACLFLAGMILLAYHRVGGFPFVAWDDGVFVTENARVKTGMSWENFRWSWGIHGPGQWHPLAWWSHQLDCQWFGLEAGRHHQTSLAIHIAGAIALLAALQKLTGHFWPSLLASALFALHPLNVESVAWIAERRDVLSTLFLALTLLAYASYAQRGGLLRYLLTLSLFALGLMAKPMLVTLPALLLVLDWWPLGRFRSASVESFTMRTDSPRITTWSSGWLLIEKLTMVAIAGLSAWLSYRCQLTDGSVISLASYPLSFRLANAVVSYVLYLRNMAWPWNLGPVYPLARSFDAWQVWGAGGILLLISVVAIWQARRRPYILVGWLWYLGTLIPVSGLLRMGAEVALADRYAYVPLIGIYIIVAWGLYDLARTSLPVRYAVAVSCIAIIIGCSILTWRQVGFWQDNITLFQRAIAVAPENPIAYGNLGYTYQGRNQPNLAIRYFRRSLKLKPKQAAIENEWGNVVRSQGKEHLQDAIPHYLAALQIDPGLAVAHDNVGSAYYALGDSERAKKHHQQAVSLNPEFGRAHYNLANVFREQQDTDAAIIHYREALRLDPEESSVLINLGNLLHETGAMDEAMQLFRKAARLRPDDLEAHVNLGNALLQQGQLDEARLHYQQALRHRADSAEAHIGLGSALALQHKLPEAIEQFQAALKIQPEHPVARENLRRAEAELNQRP